MLGVWVLAIAFAYAIATTSVVQEEAPIQGNSYSQSAYRNYDSALPSGRARAYQAPTYGGYNNQGYGQQGGGYSGGGQVIQANAGDAVLIPTYTQGGSSAGGYYPAGGYAGGTGGTGGGGAGAGFCFSGDTEVMTEEGPKRMDALKIGDWVLAIDENNKQVNAKINSWFHRVPEQEADFLKITFSDDSIVKITPGHLVFKTECNALGQNLNQDQISLNAVPSENLETGDCLYSPVESTGEFTQVRVESIETVQETGIYSPMTSTGNLFVNNVLASCFSINDKFSVQENFAKFVAGMDNLFGAGEKTDLPLSFNLISTMMDYVIPKSH